MSALDVVKAALAQIPQSPERPNFVATLNAMWSQEKEEGVFFKGVTEQRVLDAYSTFLEDPEKAFDFETALEKQQRAQALHSAFIQSVSGIESGVDEREEIAQALMGKIQEGDFPDFSGAIEFRPIGFYPGQEFHFPQFAGAGEMSFVGQTIKQDPLDPLRTSFEAAKGTPAAMFQAARGHIISASRSQPGSPLQTPAYVLSASQESASLGYTGKPTTFSKPSANKRMTAYRDPKTGRFARPEISLSKEQGEEIGKKIKEFLIRNYQDKIGDGHGGEQTGALKQAVERSEVRVDASGDKGLAISVTLADEPGRNRMEWGEYRSERPTTAKYGQWVFEGRRAVVGQANGYNTGDTVAEGSNKTFKARTFMRFFINGKWVTTRNVLPSRTDLNVFELSAEQTAELKGMVMQMMTGDR